MTQKAERNDSINDSCDKLINALQQDIAGEHWLSDVLSASERLRAVIDMMRHKLDGLPLH